MTRPAKSLVEWFGLGCILPALAALPALAFAAQEHQMEEVVVTGSYIRRDSFDTSSPLDVMTTADVEEQGTPVLGEILRNSTYNYGVTSVTNILGSLPQFAPAASANFRGLGANATLTLLDGRRTVDQTLANLYPEIFIERVEALTDGAAALYGSDAVGGVLNIIPRKDYEGIEVRAGYNGTGDGDWGDKVWSIIGGTKGDRGNFVGAFEYRARDMLQFFDRKEYSLGAASYSSTSWPGNFIVPNRLPADGGAISGTSQRRDPGCGQNNDSTSKAAGVLAKRQGTALASTTCLWEFGQNFNYISAEQRFTGVARFEYELTDAVSFESELLYNHVDTRDRGSPSNPGGRNSELPWIPGENPGNPYRAFIDVNNNGVYEPAGGDQLLYAQDANGDGIPDRDPNTDLDNNGLGDVILGGGGGTDPTQGIAFNEDVKVSAWRPVGYPFVPPTRNRTDGTGKGDAQGYVTNHRWVGQVNFEIPDSTWSGYLSYTYHDNVFTLGGRTESLSAMSSGFNGTLQVRDEATGSSQLAWFNPFTTQNFACVNRDCSGGVVQTDPDQINDPVVYDQVAAFEPPRTRTTLNSLDLIGTGDLVDMPAGPLGLAAGAEYRKIRYAVDTGGISNALDSYIGVGTPDYNETRYVYSGFVELDVPVFENEMLGLLDLSGAVRRQWVDDHSLANLDHTDYKVGARWGVRSWMALRASWGTSFITPSLANLFAPFSLGLSNVTDPWLSSGAFIARSVGGNPNLQPEEADVWNVGVSLRLLDDDLSISFDWKDFNFNDRIIRPVPQEIVDLDVANAQAQGIPITPAGLDTWLASGMSDPRIERNAANGNIIEVVLTDLINAQKMDWTGFDASLNYTIDSADLPFTDAEFGQFQAGFDVTFVNEFNYTSTSGSEIKGAGKRNNGVAAVPPSPKWRMNMRFGWNYDRHAVVVYGRYISEIRQAQVADPFCAASLAGINIVMQATNPCPSELDRYTTWDVQYTANLDGLIWGDRSSAVSVGLINAFNKKAQKMVTLGGLETQVYDPRNRILYARFTMQI